MTLTESLKEALDNVTIDVKDRPLVEIAYLYAEKLQFARDDDAVKKFGPEFLKVLIELGLTPKARAAITQQFKEVASDGTDATFQDARAAAKARYQRAHSTEDLDSPIS